MISPAYSLHYKVPRQKGQPYLCWSLLQVKQVDSFTNIVWSWQCGREAVLSFNMLCPTHLQIEHYHRQVMENVCLGKVLHPTKHTDGVGLERWGLLEARVDFYHIFFPHECRVIVSVSDVLSGAYARCLHLYLDFSCRFNLYHADLFLVDISTDVYIRRFTLKSQWWKNNGWTSQIHCHGLMNLFVTSD